MKNFVNLPRTLIAVMMVIFFWGYSIYYASCGKWIEIVFFIPLGALFAWQVYENGSVVTADKIRVRKKFLGFTIQEMTWNQIQEMGLIGEDVFSRSKKGKHRSGDKYIYFSPYTMDEKSRFNMIVKWPPKDIIYTEYSEEKLEHFQFYWNGPLKTYNVEDLYPTTKD